METIAQSGSHSFQCQPYILLEAFHFSGKRSFQSKLFLLVACNRNYSIQWKLFLLMEHISFIGSHSFQGKLFLAVVETFSFIRSHFFLEEAAPFNRKFPFQWKPFLLVKAIPQSFILMEAILFNGNHCQKWKSIFWVVAICFIRSYSFQWKMLFLVETIPFSGL